MNKFDHLHNIKSVAKVLNIQETHNIISTSSKSFILYLKALETSVICTRSN